MILLLAALTSATMLVVISGDLFRGRTALGPLLIDRAQSPGRFWAVLFLYAAAAMAILIMAIYDRAQQSRADQPTDDASPVILTFESDQ
ncbi:MAG: hypothetical protein IE933_07395 [Sphingomonadales bacterium]|nr:hypothetical protein [Sphingomonadales bacterium]MBD3773480.1 hypothetical protein [Paracoccaceae bacterium]